MTRLGLSKFDNRELSELAHIEIGRTPSRANPTYWGGSQKWLTISDFEHGDHIEKTKEAITEEAIEECGVRIHEPGTLVMSFKLTIGKLGTLREPMATNEAIAALKPIDRTVIDDRYLFHFLSQFNFDGLLDRAAKGRTLNKAKLNRLLISFPRSINEQQRIAAILDKADSIRRKRRQALAEIDTLLRSAYQTLVSAKHPNFTRWQRKNFEELAAQHKGSMRTGPFGSDLRHSEFVDEGIAVLGIDNAVTNRFAWVGRRYITPEKYEGLRRYRAYPGDVIVTIMGTTGRSAVVPDDIPEAITTKHLATITLDRHLALPEFIAFAIHSDPRIVNQITRANKGAIMDGLNLGIIKHLEIALPPIEDQDRFARVYRKLNAHKARLELPEVNGDELFNSLAQRAFRGEL